MLPTIDGHYIKKKKSEHGQGVTNTNWIYLWTHDLCQQRAKIEKGYDFLCVIHFFPSFFVPLPVFVYFSSYVSSFCRLSLSFLSDMVFGFSPMVPSPWHASALSQHAHHSPLKMIFAFGDFMGCLRPWIFFRLCSFFDVRTDWSDESFVAKGKSLLHFWPPGFTNTPQPLATCSLQPKDSWRAVCLVFFLPPWWVTQHQSHSAGPLLQNPATMSTMSDTPSPS